METQIFQHAKIYLIFVKKSSNRRNQNPSRCYYNSIRTNLKFQHKPKYHLSKNPHIKIRPGYYYLVGGPKSLKLLLYSVMNLNTISLLW
jgi:hypothetical protein